MSDFKINPAIILLQKAFRSNIKNGELITFACPCCGGRASGGRNAKNGKLYAYCGECGTSAQE